MYYYIEIQLIGVRERITQKVKVTNQGKNHRSRGVVLLEKRGRNGRSPLSQ